MKLGCGWSVGPLSAALKTTEGSTRVVVETNFPDRPHHARSPLWRELAYVLGDRIASALCRWADKNGGASALNPLLVTMRVAVGGLRAQSAVFELIAADPSMDDVAIVVDLDRKGIREAKVNGNPWR